MTRFCVWVYARQSVYPHGEPSKFISVFGTCTFSSVQWKRKMKKLLFSSFPAFSWPPLTGKYSLTAWHKNMWNKTRQKLLEKSFKFMHCPLFKKKTFTTALLLLNCSKIWIYDYFLLWCNSSVHFVDLSLILFDFFCPVFPPVAVNIVAPRHCLLGWEPCCFLEEEGLISQEHKV